MTSPGRKRAGTQQATRDPREPYEPPRVTYAEIEVEEALMSICKTTTGPGPVGGCSLQPCGVVGS